jgi:hypothetical protein
MLLVGRSGSWAIPLLRRAGRSLARQGAFLAISRVLLGVWVVVVGGRSFCLGSSDQDDGGGE